MRSQEDRLRVHWYAEKEIQIKLQNYKLQMSRIDLDP